MSNFEVCFGAVFPLLAIMAVGFATRKTGLVGAKDVEKMNAVMFRVFLPVLLFEQIYSSDLSSAVRPKVLVYALGGVLAAFALSILLARLCIKNRTQRSVVIQGMYRSNFVIIGIPIAESLLNGADILVFHLKKSVNSFVVVNHADFGVGVMFTAAVEHVFQFLRNRILPDGAVPFRADVNGTNCFFHQIRSHMKTFLLLNNFNRNNFRLFAEKASGKMKKNEKKSRHAGGASVFFGFICLIIAWRQTILTFCFQICKEEKWH